MMMKSKNADYGFDIEMTFFRAIRVAFWRVVMNESWRSIAWLWLDHYDKNEDKELKGNQFYGISVLDCAATTLGFSDYCHGILKESIKCHVLDTYRAYRGYTFINYQHDEPREKAKPGINEEDLKQSGLVAYYNACKE